MGSPAVHTLELLGSFALRSPDGALVPLPRKAAALIAYCALAGGREVARDRLSGLLWEDASETQARTSLRQALAVLRRACPPGGLLRAQGQALTLDWSAVQVDCRTFEMLASGTPDQRREAAALFHGDLLDGFDAIGTHWSAWLAAERSRVRAIAVALLESEADKALLERHPDEAIALALRLVAVESLHEPGHRLLMRALARAGRPGEALRHYRALQTMLREELSVPPEPATVALAAELAGRRREVVPAAAAAGPDEGDEAPEAVPSGPDAEARIPRQLAPARDLRRIAVLTVGLDDPGALAASRDIETWQRMIEAWHLLVEREVQAAGGQVHDRLGDTAVALFGAETARLDDPWRAASAALAIHRGAGAVPGLGVRSVRAGLAAGAVLMTVGAGEQAAIGAPVTLAGRLQAEAPAGETLVAAALAPELAPRIGLAPAGEGVARLLATSPDPVDAPLAGRERELHHLAALMGAARSGRGMTVALRGEPGIGKSRLAEALRARAREEGYRVVTAEIADFGEKAGLSPRRQLARALAHAADGSDALAAVTVALLARLDPRHRWALMQIGAVPPRPGEASHEDDVSESDRQAAFAALLGEAAREAPLFLLVEDVHWATPEGLAQLAALATRVAEIPAFLLLTVRAEEDPLDLAWRQGAGPLLTIDLAPLAVADLTVAARAFGAADDAKARACAERANGNPLFLRQLVAAVQDGAEACEALPGSVQSLALGRLDRLEPPERAAIRAAAILGRDAELAAVRAVSGVAHYTPTPQASGVLVRLEGDRLQFAHALIRDAVRSSVLESEARALHSRAAAHYRDKDIALAARHLERAEDSAAAEAWAQAAARELQRHRADRAAAFAARGVPLAADAALRAQLLTLLATALLRQRKARDAIAAARAAAGCAGSPADRVAARIAEADALAAAQQPDEALAALALAEREAEAADLALLLARIHTLKGTIHFPRGHLADGLTANRAALVWARRAGSELAEAGAHAGLAWSLYQMGAFAEGAQEADQCLAVASAPGFDRVRLSALRARAVCRTFLLQHDAGLLDADEAAALAREQGDSINEVLARTTAATIHLECWRLEDAIATVEPAFALARPHAAVGIEAAPLWVIGTATGALGQPTVAERHLRQARVLASGSSAIRFALPRILGTLAFFTGSDERLELIAEGEACLVELGVAHSGLGLWSGAALAALFHKETALVDRAHAGLTRWGGAPLCPWAQMMLTLAGSYRPLIQGAPDPEAVGQAEAFHAEARRHPSHGWIRPVMAAVEIRAGLRPAT